MENYHLWGDIMARLAVNNINVLEVGDSGVAFEYQWRTPSGVAKWSKAVRPYIRQDMERGLYPEFGEAAESLGYKIGDMNRAEEMLTNILSLVYEVRYVRSVVEGA